VSARYRHPVGYLTGRVTAGADALFLASQDRHAQVQPRLRFIGDDSAGEQKCGLGWALARFSRANATDAQGHAFPMQPADGYL
jgi:hypothetical protein